VFQVFNCVSQAWMIFQILKLILKQLLPQYIVAFLEGFPFKQNYRHLTGYMVLQKPNRIRPWKNRTKMLLFKAEFINMAITTVLLYYKHLFSKLHNYWQDSYALLPQTNFIRDEPPFRIYSIRLERPIYSLFSYKVYTLLK